MATNIGPKIGIDGEAEFRKQINSINDGIKTLGSEMKVVTSEFIGNEKSVEALTAKNDVLGRTVFSLNERLQSQQEMLAACAEKYGEADAKTQAWQRAVNETQAKINQYNAEIAQNEAQIAEDADAHSAAEKAISAAGSAIQKTGDVIAKAAQIGAVAVAALGAAATAAVAGVAKLTVDAGYAADEINTMAAKTGISTEELQKFQYASEVIDVSVDTLAGSMSKLTGNMDSARDGSGAAAEAFAALGVSVTDGNGELRDRNEVFAETIKALGEVTNETERDAIAMKVFGKSAKELNPLIEGGAERLQELGEEAEAAGLIMSQETLNDLNSVSDAMDKMKATADAAKNQFMAGFAGPVSQGLGMVTGYMTQLSTAFAQNGIDGLLAAVQEVLPQIMAAMQEYLPQIIKFGTDLVLKIVDGMTQMLPDLIDMSLTVITTVANALADFLPELIPAAVDMIMTIVEALIDNIDQLVDAAIAITIALADGLIDALPKLISKAPTIIQKLVAAIIENAPKLLDAAFELIVKLGQGIVDNLPKVAEAAVSIVQTIINGISSLWSRIVEIGKNIVTGVWEGIKNSALWLYNNIVGFFSDAVEGVKEFLGIASPSKVFAGIGTNMALGLGQGFEDTMDKVSAEMQSAIPTQDITLSQAASGIVNGLGAQMGGYSGSLTVNVMLENGALLGRAFIADLFDAASANGRPIAIAP